MDSRLTRVRAFLSEQFRLVVVVAVAVALLGGMLSYSVYAGPPPVQTEERVVSSWTSSEEFTHGATVVENSSLYAPGTQLENRPAYFTPVVDQVDGTYIYRYDASSSGNLTVTAQTVLVVRSIDERRYNGTVRDVEYWRTSKELGAATVESVDPGQAVEVPFTVDLNDTAERIEAIREEVGAHGTIEVTVRVETQVSGEVNGESVNQTNRYELPMLLQDRIVRVYDPDVKTNQYEQTEPVAVESTYSPMERVGSALLLAVPLVFLMGTTVARATGRLSPTAVDRDVLAHNQARTEYDEWITPGRLSEALLDRPVVTVASLEGLVDLAIDVDGRVIEDVEAGGYVVAHDGILYTYSPPR